MPPTITALYAGLLAVFIVLLAARVAKFRHANKIGIGEGDNRTLARMIRVHGNAIENAPLYGLLENDCPPRLKKLAEKTVDDTLAMPLDFVRLKRLLADSMLDNAALKDLLSKKW